MKKIIALLATTLAVAFSLTACAPAEQPDEPTTLSAFSEEFPSFDMGDLERGAGVNVIREGDQWLLTSKGDRSLGTWLQRVTQTIPDEEGRAQVETPDGTVHFLYKTVIDGEKWSLRVSRSPIQ